MYNKAQKPQNHRRSDWFSIICLLVLLIIAASRLTLTKWVSDLNLVGWLILFGAFSGYWLGKSRLHWTWALVISTIATLIVIPLFFAVNLSGQSGIAAQIVEICARILSASRELLANQPVSDSILFLVGSGLLFWILGVGSGFTLVRNSRFWIPLVILGIVLLFIESYQPEQRRSIYTWIYISTLLILSARVYFLNMKDSYSSNGNQIGSDSEFDFMRGAVSLVICIGIIAWIFPNIVRVFTPDTVEQTRMTQRWETLTEHFENLFYSLNQEAQTVEQAIAEDMALGTGQILGEEDVMYIQTDLTNSLNRPFYWRGKTYDVYQDGRWKVGSAYTKHFKSSESIHQIQPVAGQTVVKFRVTNRLDELTQIYISGNPIEFNRAIEGAVAAQTNQNSELLAYFVDPGLGRGETYRFESIVSVPTSDQLREAGTQYPVYIHERYLQLPSDISQRILDLGNEITKNQETPFDKATAVTLYLRKNIQYQATIQPPPKNQDPIDWFIFDYKKGFCNYSASAEVLLLRAVGVPARLAVGYAQGAADESGRAYSVRRDDSHAWPEVYFPGYGWIAFEPTGSLPYSDWTTSSVTGLPSGSGASGENPNADGESSLQTVYNGEERANQYLEEIGAIELSEEKPKISVFGWVLISFLSTGFIALCIFSIIKIRRNKAGLSNNIRRYAKNLRRKIISIPLIGYWIRSIRLPEAEKNFLSIEFGLSLLGLKMNPGITAREMAAYLSEEVPEVKHEIACLLSDYQDYEYGQYVQDYRKGKRECRKVIVVCLQKKGRRLLNWVDRVKQRFN